MEDNEDTLKRQHEEDTLQRYQDASPTDTKRLKLNTDTAGDTLLQEPPLISSSDNQGNQQVEGSSSLNTTLQVSTTNGNQQDNANPATIPSSPLVSSSPFALHPILDELTSKPTHSNNDHEASGMRMSMSAILTETGKGYQDRPFHQINDDNTETVPSRGQSLPPSNNLATDHRSSHTLTTPSFSQPQTSHHHRNSSHPVISSMMMTEQQNPTPDNQMEQAAEPSPDNRQQQSITNEELVRALTTSIPMDTDHSPQQPTDKKQHQSPISDETEPALPPSTTNMIKQEDDDEESYTLTTASPHHMSTSSANDPFASSSSSFPDFGAALRRLSGTTGALEGQNQYHTKKEDVSPSEILGSALAAVARSQQNGSSTTAAAAAIGNLAAITANISHILNSNNAIVTATPPVSSPTKSSPSAPRISTPVSSSPSHSLISLSTEQQQQQGQGQNKQQSSADQALHTDTVSTMLDQAVQLGRTQHHQLQQNESSAGGMAGTPTVNQETLDGMKRAAEAAATAAAAIAANRSSPATATPPSTSSPIRLHNHHHQQHHLHHHSTNGSASPSSSLLPHHHHHYQQHYQHPQQTPSLYGQPMYATSSLHAPSPALYNASRPPAVAKPPKLIIKNDQVWQAVKGKKETNLGFYLYQPSMLLPNFQEHLNGIIQVRVPARYLTYENPKVKKRAVWGTGIYTDDSDIVTMAIHSGKFIPAHHDPELESYGPFLLAVAGKSTEYIRAATKKHSLSPKTYLKVRDDTVPDHDIKITLRVLPKLQQYTSTIQHRIKSRPWGGNHDGISLFVEKVEQLEKGEARLCGRGSLKSNIFRRASETIS